MKKIVNIERFREYLSEKYPDNEYQIIDGEIFTNSKVKIKVLHKSCGNIVMMSSHDFTENHSCPVCNKEKMKLIKTSQTGKKNKRSSDELKRLATENNPDYNIYGLENIYNGESYVNIECPKCGLRSYQKVKYIINSKYSCRSCSRKISKEKFLERFYKTHPEFYSINLDDFSTGFVTVKCNLCNKEKKYNIHQLLRNTSMCHCKNELLFKEKSSKMYNSEFEYISGYKNIKSSVTFRHIKCGKLFNIRASHFLYDGCSCTRCRTYKNEEKIKEILELKGISFIPQKTFDNCKNIQKLQFDIFIPIFNLVIEYDGEGHFRPIFSSKDDFNMAVLRDSIKEKFVKENKINILRIPYWRKDSIGTIIDEVIKFYKECHDYTEIQDFLNTYRKNENNVNNDKYLY